MNYGGEKVNERKCAKIRESVTHRRLPGKAEHVQNLNPSKEELEYQSSEQMKLPFVRNLDVIPFCTLKINLKHFKMSDLKNIACGLKDSKITTLRLSCSGPDCDILRFRVTDPTTSNILMRFFRELAESLSYGGWLKHLELGFNPWKRDLRVLSQAIGCSTTLQRLSLANSTLGDAGLQLLAQGLCNCSPLQILDLSGCALSDSSQVSLASVLKASIGLNAGAEWQSSLREGESRKVRTKISSPSLHRGLYALDLSFNFLSDTSANHICCVLRLGGPLEVLNLQGNKMQRKSMKRFISIFQIWGILRIVDLRDNLDQKGVGVLENGEHLSFFSVPHEPFWKSDGSLGEKQILKGFVTTSQVLKKEPSPRSKDCVSGFKEIGHPSIYEAKTPIDNQILSNSKTSGTSDMKQIPNEGAGSLSLSPLPEVDTDSANLIPSTIPASRCWQEKPESACALDCINNNDMQLGITSRPVSPHNYLSTPTDYSDYVHLWEGYPDILLSPVDLTSGWDCCCTSVSVDDDTRMTDLSFSPTIDSNKMSFDQPMNHAGLHNMPTLYHSTLTCKMSKYGRQYKYGGVLEAQAAEVSTHLSATADHSEASHDDLEWDAFLNDMARHLLHVQDGLDVVISSAELDFLITSQNAMTTLQEGLQQLLTLEI